MLKRRDTRTLYGGVKVNKKLFDSELKVMNVIWREGCATAKHIAEVLRDQYGWSASTTYTLISRCIKKGAISRSEPNFLCTPLVSRDEVQAAETDEFIDRMFDGSADKLFSALVSRKKVSADEISRLRHIADDIK